MLTDRFLFHPLMTVIHNHVTDFKGLQGLHACRQNRQDTAKEYSQNPTPCFIQQGYSDTAREVGEPDFAMLFQEEEQLLYCWCLLQPLHVRAVALLTVLGKPQCAPVHSLFWVPGSSHTDERITR